MAIMETGLQMPSQEDVATASVFKNFKECVHRRKDAVEKEHKGIGKQQQKLMEAGNDANGKSVHMQQMQEKALRAKPNEMSRSTNDLEALMELGRGTFGVVHLVRIKGEPELYALKQMSKEHYQSSKNHMQPYKERDALAKVAQARAQWIVRLYATFQDQKYLYMLTEYLAGGDFISYMEEQGRLSLHVTRFYMAELLVALDTVHRSGFVHRDIKPDNMALSATGHLKLLDFGLAKNPAPRVLQEEDLLQPPDERGAEGDRGRVIFRNARERIRTRAGTPVYWAPEVWECNYGKEADIWAAGIITFECLVGRVPFYAERNDGSGRPDFTAIRRMVTDERKQARNFVLKKSEEKGFLNQVAKKFIEQILTTMDRRLDYKGCRKHPFFFNYFENLQTMTPPIEVKARKLDCQNIEPYALPPAEPWYEQDPMLEWDGYEFDRDGDNLGSSQLGASGRGAAN